MNELEVVVDELVEEAKDELVKVDVRCGKALEELVVLVSAGRPASVVVVMKAAPWVVRVGKRGKDILFFDLKPLSVLFLIFFILSLCHKQRNFLIWIFGCARLLTSETLNLVWCNDVDL